VRVAVDALAPVADEHELVVTHGNGPQVGVLANESERDGALSRPYPFDALGAQAQGMIGYWLLQALRNARPARRVAALITRTLVAADDPALGDPSEFVGPVFDESTAQRLQRDRSWVMRADEAGWRGVVPSPAPLDVVELTVIGELLAAGDVVAWPAAAASRSCGTGADS
jgi:carbamate kinase